MFFIDFETCLSYAFYSLHILDCILCGCPVPLGYQIHNFYLLCWCTVHVKGSSVTETPDSPARFTVLVAFCLPFFPSAQDTTVTNRAISCTGLWKTSHTQLFENLFDLFKHRNSDRSSFVWFAYKDRCVLSVFCVLSIFRWRAILSWPGFMTQRSACNFILLTFLLVQPCFSSICSFLGC